MEEADFEKTNDDARERSFMLVVVLLIISVAVHIGLMLSVSEKVFTLMTSSFLLSCFSICSSVRWSPLETMIMFETFGSSVSPTAS